MDKFNASDLTSEKSLFDIYRQALKIPASNFDKLFTLVIFIALIFQSFILINDYQEILYDVRRYSELGLQTSLAILGILVAGFTIFASISKPSLLLSMARFKNKDSGLSFLKHNFFTFIFIISNFLAFAIVCLLIIFFGRPDGVVDYLASKAPSYWNIKPYIVAIFYPFFGSFFFFTTMSLKSFIFNMNHAVMTALRWEEEFSE